MSEAWHEGLPDDYFKSPSDKIYENSFAAIRTGLAEGLGFDEACSRLEVEDNLLREQIISDMLKVLVAEEHFTKKIPLEDLSATWKLDLNRLVKTKDEMLDEIQLS